MEFSVFRQVLIRALGHMQSIVEKRATLPILVNVKIEVADNLVLSATNVDLELVEHVSADITLGGKTTVPVQMLYDIVRKLPEDAEISFKQEADQLVVSSGRAVFRLPTLPAENFPAMAGSNLTTKFQMTTGDLAHLINQTKFAIPTDDVRYHLGGIFFHISEEGKEKMLTAVATDAQRMALCAMPAPEGSVEMPSVILPRRVIGELSKLLEDATVDDVMVELYQKGDYFVIRRNWDISINHSLEQEANTLSTSFREVEICFNQFLEVEQLSSSKTFSDLFTESSEDVVNYINAEGTTNSINENYVNVIRFIKWLKDANPHYYSVVNTLLWGAIVAGFLQRKKIDPNIKIVDSVDYYLDTSIALSVLGLDSEENILYARDLVRIILDSGSTPCVHALTLREISRILRRVEIDQGPKPGTSIQHAWAEQGLCLSDILKIKNNLESKLQDEFNIAVSNMASHLLDKIEEKYKNNMDVRALAKNRGSHSEDKLRDIHDVYMRDYVNEINQVAGAGVLEKQTAFFVSLNNDMIAFANHEGQLENVIHASRVVMSLWIHSCSSHNIQRLALTETISRCFALNQTDVRRKLRLFQKYYSDCSFTKDDVSNMYTSLIRRSTQTITEVERIKSIEETDVENKDVVCQEIIQGVVQAVKKEAEESNGICTEEEQLMQKKIHMMLRKILVTTLAALSLLTATAAASGTGTVDASLFLSRFKEISRCAYLNFGLLLL